MAEVIAIFDTNVLPVSGNLDTPFWLSILRLCEVVNISPSLPEIVVHESVNMRREQYAADRTKYLAAFKRMSRFFELAPAYIPGIEQITTEWDEALRDSFLVLEMHGDDAVEALKREALRRVPAKDGKGARDSAIWLAAMRRARTGSKVILVSKNTADFAEGTDLHPALVEEAAGVDGEVVYFPGLDEFIEHMATRTDPPIIEASGLDDAIGTDLREFALEELIGEEGDERLIADQASATVHIDSDARALRSYAINALGLALIDGAGRLILDPEGGEAVRFRFRAWLDFDLSSKALISGEVSTLTLLRGPDIDLEQARTNV
jgi:hypothetical protein